MHWTQSGQYSRHREYPWNLASMQIYASYKWRRDFIDGIKSAGSLTRTRALKARHLLHAGRLSRLLFGLRGIHPLTPDKLSSP